MALISLIFFFSGISGLVYQVVWVREFGNVFGNTVYSASLIVAVFMLGLGAGSYVVGRWADRRYAIRPGSLLVTYGSFEILIGAAAFAVSAFLPHLGSISALASSYSRDANGWYVLSSWSYAARVGIAAVILTPITLLMGGTLTLLIRYCVRSGNELGAWSIALLYGVNTAGAATGAFLTDLVLIPAVGLIDTQRIAVLVNLAVGGAALSLAWRRSRRFSGTRQASEPARGHGPENAAAVHDVTFQAVAWTSVALALSGFGAMGMEIVWFRHFTVLLGGYRAVFSVLLTVVLVGIGVGSLAGGWLNRSIARPVQMLMVGEALFVLAALAGLASADVLSIRSVEASVGRLAGAPGQEWQWAGQVWHIAKPMIVEAAIPALIMGLTFPLGNAVVQRAERVVGRRAGILYLSNTLGAVCGSLLAGFLLLPAMGMQGATALLTIASGLTVVPLYLASRVPSDDRTSAGRRPILAPVASVLIAGAAVAWWLLLPADFVLARAQAPLIDGQRRLTLVEGVNEIVSVVEGGGGRVLLTNDHSMSSTTPAAQRYMRALAHIPLLSMDRPQKALVIGFGVGNTTHAISLHPTIRRVEIADLSRAILEHAGLFAEGANHGVLGDPRVAVYVEDGRQHLRMRHENTYDLIALEPPPIAQAGVGALYSREFYALARTRLTGTGCISQWLPVYQVPAETTLAMIRSFVEVFPQAVLLCGSNMELLLVGTRAPAIEIDPDRLAARLADAPAVQADLRRVFLGTVTDIVGTFVSGPRTLQQASRGQEAATDDRPVQEYCTTSRLALTYQRLPASIFDLDEVSDWCPRCFAGGKPVPLAAGLDVHLASLARGYDKMLQR